MKGIVEIVMPPVADLDSPIEAALVKLTEAIFQIAPETLSHGALGGPFGYGADLETDVFMIHPYCWCERVDCLWCTPWLGNETDCSDEVSLAHRARQIRAIEEQYGIGLESAPNFWHKPSGLTVHWYKWIGRDTQVRRSEGVDIRAMLGECIASLSRVTQ